MQINIFNKQSVIYPFRWFIVFALSLASFMTYADLTGWRLLSLSNQQQWSSSGPGSHK